MNRLVNSSSAKPKIPALSQAFVVSALLILPGCGIPPLRGPDPGAPLPQSYFPLPIFKKAPTDTDHLPAQSGDPADGQMDKAADPAVTPANFVTPASYLSEAKSEGIEAALADGAAPLASGNATAAALQMPSSVESIPPKSDDGAANAAGIKMPPSVEPLPSNSDSEAADSQAADSQPTGLQRLPDICENSSQLAFNQFFDDPFLISLIEQALGGNQELKILAEDIQIANNEIMARRGAIWPFLSWGTRAGIEKPSLFTPQGAVEDQLQVLPGKGFPDPLPNFLVAADVSWEIDIWRKLRNARDAASLRYLGTADGRNYVVTRMIAEVADNYYQLLALDSQLMTLDQTILIQQKSLKLAQNMKAAGRGTQLAVQRFQAEVRKNQSKKRIIQQDIIEAENRINFTLGRFPQPVARAKPNFFDLRLHALSLGVPAQLLRNRGDVRQAERELEAAGLDVRVARARFYPSLVLTSGVGLEAFNTKYLLTTPDSLIYNAAGNLVGPLLNKAAIRADYMNANARQLQAVYDYQRTVINAYTEVVNRITKVENYGSSIATKKRQLTALEASVATATNLFETAQGEYLDVLLAQRDMMEARMVIIETKQEQLSAIVNAYQALGGGGMMLNF